MSRWFLFGVLFLYACARVLPPDGGPLDKTPPVLDTLASTPNLQTQYRPTTLNFKFDEWIQVKDALKQVVISPPTAYPPKVISKGKEVIVEFSPDEVWKDSTTYTLSFGQAISDRSESNILPDFKFVFSTGPVLDSLSAHGAVIDAFNRQPVEDIVVILHRSGEDSTITLKLPDYFTRTNKEGLYQFSYLREGRYRLFALFDRNNNYKYDQPDERVTSLESEVIISEATQSFPILHLPPPVRKTRVVAMDTTSEAGKVTMAFNRRPSQLDFSPEMDTSVFPFWTQDTILTIWQTSGSQPSWLIADGDTVFIPAFRDSFSIAIPFVPLLTRSGKQPPNTGLDILCYPPIYYPDTSLILVTKDSLELKPTAITLSAKGDTLTFWGISPPEANVVLTFLPGALKTRHGWAVPDTIALGFITGNMNDWSTLTIVIDSLPPDQQTLLELVDAQGRSRFAPKPFSGNTTWTLTLPPLEPGEYIIYLSKDSNRNGRWDGADYYRKTPSEPRSKHAVPNLRANWELELKLTPTWAKEE